MLASLPVLDRRLPLWILLAMARGLLLGRLVPWFKAALAVGPMLLLALAWLFLPGQPAFWTGLIWPIVIPKWPHCLSHSDTDTKDTNTGTSINGPNTPASAAVVKLSRCGSANRRR